jgi:hypothetical protein
MQRAMVAGEANNAALDAQVNDIENRLKDLVNQQSPTANRPLMRVSHCWSVSIPPMV